MAQAGPAVTSSTAGPVLFIVSWPPCKWQAAAPFNIYVFQGADFAFIGHS